MAKHAAFIGVLFLALIVAAPDSPSVEKKGPERKVITRELPAAEVNGVGRSDIAVVTNQTGDAVYTVSLKVTPNTKVMRKKLTEIGIGDLVAITYDEVVLVEEGKPIKVMERVARTIEFRQKSKVGDDRAGLDSDKTQETEG